MLKSGHLYKLGEGPINYDWNLRYFVLDGTLLLTLQEFNQELTYYRNDAEVKPRGNIPLQEALVSNITLIRERDHSFSIQTAPPNGRTVFLSFDKAEEANQWRDAIVQATKR